MADRRIPEDALDRVRQFIRRRIESIEQFEILLFLYRDASRYWDAAAVAQSVHLTELQASNDLEALGRAGLLDVRIASAVLYRFNPATPRLAQEVELSADAYREHRGAVVALIAARRNRSLKDFADAFRFTEEPEDG